MAGMLAASMATTTRGRNARETPSHAGDGKEADEDHAKYNDADGDERPEENLQCKQPVQAEKLAEVGKSGKQRGAGVFAVSVMRLQEVPGKAPMDRTADDHGGQAQQGAQGGQGGDQWVQEKVAQTRHGVVHCVGAVVEFEGAVLLD